MESSSGNANKAVESSSGNIYKIARLASGMTCQKAAQLLNVSPDSLWLYESGKIVPQTDIAISMVHIYNTQHLAYQHMLYSSEIARNCLPKLNLKDLPSAILRLQKEVNDFIRLREELIDITCDGVVTPDERMRYDFILKELDEICEAITAVKYAKTE